MKKYFLLFCMVTMFLGRTSVWAQSGYIIKIDGDKIYLNLPNVKGSDIVSVLSNGGLMNDPRTGREIRQSPEVIGQIKIIAVQGNYSVGRIYGNTTAWIEEGMTVKKGTVMQKNDYGEATVMIAPAELNFPQGLNTMVGDGYIGDYVSSALMSHLLKSDKIQLVDRSIFGAYQQGSNFGYGSSPNGIYEKEMELNNSGAIDPYSALQNGKISGVRYLVKITMQKPDVVNVRNSLPVKGLANLASDVTNRPRTNNQYLPDNMNTSNIKVSVRIITHIVDLQTGKVLYITNAIGTAKGNPQIGLELNDYGNATFNSKDIDFMQTVTGQAIDEAFKKIGPQINKYFNENI